MKQVKYRDFQVPYAAIKSATVSSDGLTTTINTYTKSKSRSFVFKSTDSAKDLANRINHIINNIDEYHTNVIEIQLGIDYVEAMRKSFLN